LRRTTSLENGFQYNACTRQLRTKRLQLSSGSVKKIRHFGHGPSTVDRDWFKKQANSQIYLPATRHIPRPIFDQHPPNAFHQTNSLTSATQPRWPQSNQECFDGGRRRYAQQGGCTFDRLATSSVAEAPSRINKREPLTWPRLLQLDPRHEFTDAIIQLLSKHHAQVRRGRVDVHWDQGIVVRFNRTLAEWLSEAQIRSGTAVGCTRVQKINQKSKFPIK
jgi:hypothetical protein